MHFVHDTLPQRIRFASGAAADQLAAEIVERGHHRVMVIAGEAEQDLARRVTAGLPVAVTHHEVAMHVPVEVAARARAVARAHDADVLVPVGGGSTTGLAKAVALTDGLPIVAVPTTYAGSESTDVWGMTENGRKVTGTDRRVLPAAVVYDAALTLSLPTALSVASGLNALAHCIDALWGPRADPVSAALAGDGVRALDRGLRAIAADPRDLAGREETLLGAHLSAVAFAAAGSGLHHKICHVLGGMFGLPHAQTHAVVLGYVLALNGPAAPRAERRIADAFGAPSALAGLASLRSAVDAPTALRDHGMPESGIDEAVPVILDLVPPGNPVAVTAENLRAVLRAAWEGSPI